MKTIKLLLLALLISTIGCSKEDQENESCNCDVDVIIANPSGDTPTYTITNVPSDCNGNVEFDKLNLPENHWFQNTKNCN